MPRPLTALLDRVSPPRLGRAFRWLLGASWLDGLADGLIISAGPLLVASQTRSPALVASAVFLQRLPWLLLGLYAGVVVDRVDRRRIVIVTNLIRAVVALALCLTIEVHHVDVAVVLVAVFVLGVNQTFDDTTSQTLPPMLVPSAELGLANSRNYAGLILGAQLIGPPVGALLFAVGRALPFAGEFVCVAAAAALISQIRLPEREQSPDRTSVPAEIAEGWRWLWAHAPVRTLAITMFTFNITYGTAWSVLVLYARERLHLGPFGFGLISTAIAVGGLAGTSAFPWLEKRLSLGTIMRICLTLETLTHLALALIRSEWLAMFVFVIFGAYAFVWGTTATSVRQRAVPERFLGRVGSVYLVGLFGGLVIGSALGGAIAQVWGVVAPFWVAFVATAIILACIWRSLPAIAHARATD
jgi:MFS family permease